MRGTIAASSEPALYKQLNVAGLELIKCTVMDENSRGLSDLFSSNKVHSRDLIQLFMHMSQMQGAGVPLMECLADIRDTTENDGLRDVMSEIYRDVSEGKSLSDAMSRHPKVFESLHVSLVQAGEDTGDLTAIYEQLIKYMTWVDEMQSRVKQATRYPMILMGVVVLVVVIMMGYVVPQVVGFLDNIGQELGFVTLSLIAVSNFFANPVFSLFGVGVPGGVLIVLIPILLWIVVKVGRAISDDFAYTVDSWILRAPVMGPIIRKITIARYAQTFSALFSSGIDVISALQAARKTVVNLTMLEALDAVERYVQAGSSLSDAFNTSGEFPSMVVRMVKVGEESGNLSHMLSQVSEFYTKDVDEAVQGLIAMIEPALTGILGVLVLWIAAAVFGPIYGMLESIDI